MKCKEVKPMKKSKVAIMRCENYEPEQVNKALRTGMELIGGVENFFDRQEKILLKPNLLVKASPEKCVTTHPAVFGAVMQLLQEEGFLNVGYGDSPGNPIGGVEKTAEGSGLKQEAERYGIPLENFSEGVSLDYPEGVACRNFTICKGVLEADGIINLCKMKTHQLERITGAVKNTFGCVYGINKMAFHAKYPDADSFGKMLIDLNLAVKPRLHIMDGVMAMEGNGPQSGTPVAMKVLLISEDPVAIDVLFARLVHLDPFLVPTNRYGEEYGLGKASFDKMELVTENGPITLEQALVEFGNPEFDVYRGIEADTQLKMLKPLVGLFQKRPAIIKEKCISCGVCVDSCPIGKSALKFPKDLPGNGVPKYDYGNCIRCYCCQELCPQKAIEVKVPLMTRLLDRKWKL